jgi:glyoxylase I family protein
MPTFSRVSHISFSVRDTETSARWWAALLELTEIDRVVGDGWHAILLLHPPSRTVIEFQRHDGNQGETFDPRRTGFDHMGFKVDTRVGLDEWLARFEQLGVRHSPIAECGTDIQGPRRHSVRDVLQSRPPIAQAKSRATLKHWSALRKATPRLGVRRRERECAVAGNDGCFRAVAPKSSVESVGTHWGLPSGRRVTRPKG